MGRGHVILLDANVLIDLGRYTLRPESTYGASILSRAELEFGILAAKTAETAAEARATGAKVRRKDALIAAQASRHGASLMTTNLEDFRPFDHLVQIVSPTPFSEMVFPRRCASCRSRRSTSAGRPPSGGWVLLVPDEAGAATSPSASRRSCRKRCRDNCRHR